jgi:diguanylate cyclase (GGDEF)-like protein
VRRYVVPFGRGLMGWAVEHGEPVLANDALNDPRAMQIPGTPDDPEALVVVPLVADGEVIGCMNISRVGGQEVYFSDADFDLVKLFAGQASIALRNAEAHQAITVRAETDALTGLGNHGAFQRTLADVLGQPEGSAATPRRRTRQTGPIALLMMDLDNFKAYNDRLGHPAGDALLHAVGTAIYASARAEDGVFRYGGDEFALVLPGVDALGAEAIGERVRGAVARLTAKEASRVTITVGVAAYPHDAADKNDLIAAADTALYLGKQSGEDRVVRADQVPPEMRALRTTLDELARAALQHPDEGPTVDSLVEQAARLTHASEGDHGTVRDALLAVARSMDVLDPATIGHGDRVGRLARLTAEKLDCDEGAANAVELAARLHGLEAIGSAELEAIPSLREVGDIVAWHREGSAAGEPPLGARIVAAANAYDALVSLPDGPHADRRQAIDELSAAGSRYGADVLKALAEVVGVKPRAERRRRRSDRLDAAPEDADAA